MLAQLYLARRAMKRTKIVCTLGPATESEAVLAELIRSGMNVARLNFSHGSYDEHEKKVNLVKKMRDQLGVPLPLMLDLKGPDLRIKKFANDSVTLKQGDAFTFTVRDIVGDQNTVSINYAGLPDDVAPGDTILLSDGLIEMRVVRAGGGDIVCEVINGGVLSNNKGMNVPGKSLNLPYLREKDHRDAAFGIMHGFEFFAASFVRTANDVRELRNLLEEQGGVGIKIIAKIENRQGVDNIDDILRTSDGIMIARGDMGSEIPFEELPAIQKLLIRKAVSAGKPVITATQMLESMIQNPRPTRAEITDVANAIYDGTSAIMLSGETSVGKYPVQAVQTMSKIAVETESNIDYAANFTNAHYRISRNITNAISHATCDSAHMLGAAAIITLTQSGHTARMVSKYRPACPVIAITATWRVYQQLALSWGVFPQLADEVTSIDQVFEQAIQKASATEWIKNGDLIIITGGFPVGISGTTNTMRVHIIGDVLAEGKGANGLRASGSLHVLQNATEVPENFNEGDILVIRETTDAILPLLKDTAAIITEEDAADSKAVIVGKALGIPVITNVNNATSILKSGIVVTVDAATGRIVSGVK